MIGENSGSKQNIYKENQGADCIYGIDSYFWGFHRVLQQIEGNLIYPHVVGESVGLPSIWVLAAVTIGGNLMGIVGMLVEKYTE